MPRSEDQILQRLLYVSLSAIPSDSPEIARIARVSQSRNCQCGVTGYLYYDDEIFVQVLEGLEQDVTSIYRSICADERHSQIRTLLVEETERRHFGGWAMGFHEGTVDTRIDGLPGRRFHAGATGIDPRAVVRFLRDLTIDFKGVRLVAEGAQAPD